MLNTWIILEHWNTGQQWITLEYTGIPGYWTIWNSGQQRNAGLHHWTTIDNTALSGTLDNNTT
ncbi:hypothetical protein Glove_19g69 [Diversispora epigaea]|uniref:Uncharacterized protein n=1 Tax=Diversispora epigaea TaxID=1348612 RepID=A0A397JKZ1_9GLOM|nr:hypothetical protein Glove_19g69 [Diversispora epigaea]